MCHSKQLRTNKNKYWGLVVLGLTINFFNLRVECKMLDYNYDLHKDTISNGRCVVPFGKEDKEH